MDLAPLTGVGFTGIASGLVGKILFDWLAGRRNGNGNGSGKYWDQRFDALTEILKEIRDDNKQTREAIVQLLTREQVRAEMRVAGRSH